MGAAYRQRGGMGKLKSLPQPELASRELSPAEGTFLLALAVGLGLGAYLSLMSSWPWLLLPLVALAAAGCDLLLRSNSAIPLQGPAATAPYILLPSLIVLAAGLLAQQVAEGAWDWLAAALAAVSLGIAVHAEHVTAEGFSRTGSSSRPVGLAYLLLHSLAYLTALAIFAFIEVSLESSLAIIATGLVATLLSVELLSDLYLDTTRHLAYAGAIGLVLLEARWALSWLSMASLPAALLLLLIFYLAIGLVLAHRQGHLSWTTRLEFAAVGAIGLGLVLAANAIV